MGKALDAIKKDQSETMGLGFFLAVTLFPTTQSCGRHLNETKAEEGCARTPANIDPDLEADRGCRFPLRPITTLKHGRRIFSFHFS